MICAWVDGALDALLPPRCLQCDARTPEPVCDTCQSQLPWHSGATHHCVLCADSLPHGGQVCAACQQHPPAFTHTIAPFYWADPIDDWISRLKYQADLHVATNLAALCAPVFQRLARPDWPDMLVPVPLHDDKIRARGFNQSLELARLLGRQLDVSVRTDIAQRTRPTPPQRGANRASRRRNVRGAFACLPHADINGIGHIAIIDDVLTTGATAHALALALRRAGARCVSVWVVTRTTYADRAAPAYSQ